MAKIERAPDSYPDPKVIRWGRNKGIQDKLKISYHKKDGTVFKARKVKLPGFFFARRGEAPIKWPLFSLDDAKTLWDGEPETYPKGFSQGKAFKVKKT